MAIAAHAAGLGLRPCILTRGYRGTASGPCFVSRGSGPMLNAAEAGDEPFLMASRLAGVPVVKSADRYEGGLFALAELGSGDARFVFILDDGFQHWRLHRDLDVLLINGSDPFGRQRLLPFGRLREPIAEMRRAGVIVITKTRQSAAGRALQDDLIRETRLHNPDAPVFFAEYIPAMLRTSAGGTLPLTGLNGKKVFAFCGIGRPESFRETLLGMGAEVTGFRAFRDHARYSAADIDLIAAEADRCRADWIVTTEKDIIKIKEFRAPERLAALCIEFGIDKGFYEVVFSPGLKGRNTWSSISM